MKQAPLIYALFVGFLYGFIIGGVLVAKALGW